MSAVQQVLVAGGAASASWKTATALGYKWWSDVCMSADGTIMYACVGGDGFTGQIYKSSDSGATWGVINVGLNAMDWRAICCSSDGQTIYATTTGNTLVKLTGGGANFQGYTPTGGSGTIIDVCCSSDGVYVFIIYAGGAYVFRSTDSGANWSQVGPYQSYTAISCGGTGQSVHIGTYNSGMFRSWDYGINISAAATLPNNSTNVVDVTSARAEGSTAWAVIPNWYPAKGQYEGALWSTPIYRLEDFKSVACSSDGLKLLATAPNGICYGTVAAQAMTSVTGPTDPTACAMSDDGSKRIAVGKDSYIYTYS